MENELLKYFGGLSIVIIILILTVLNIDKIIIVLNIIFLKPFSFVKKIGNKQKFIHIQSKINDICKNIDTEFFSKSLKIKWLKGSDKEEIYSEIDKYGEIITVNVFDRNNPNKNITAIVEDYVSTSFVPTLKSALDNTIVNANEKYIVSKIILKLKNSALTAFYNKNKISSDEIKSLIKTIREMDNKGYYFPLFIRSLLIADDKLLIEDNAIDNEEINEEVQNFISYSYKIASKAPQKNPSLAFWGNLIKVCVILVAKEIVLDSYGLQAHLNRIKKEMKRSMDLIFIAGRGKENRLNVKRLFVLIKKEKELKENLNKFFEEERILTTKKGKSYPFIIGGYENYYYKTINFEPEIDEEVENVLLENIPEIADGSIHILSIERQKGYMTKILLKTELSRINILACCMGKNYVRRNKIRDNLNEQICFVEYSEDPEILIRNALIPFKNDWIDSIDLFKQNKIAVIYVSNDQRIAGLYGKQYINIKLVEKLTGWKIEAKKTQNMKQN